MSCLIVFLGGWTDFSQLQQAHVAFAKAIKLNHKDAGLCTSFALVCMILGDINSAVISLLEVTPSPLSPLSLSPLPSPHTSLFLPHPSSPFLSPPISRLISHLGPDNLPRRPNRKRTHEPSTNLQRRPLLRSHPRLVPRHRNLPPPLVHRPPPRPPQKESRNRDRREKETDRENKIVAADCEEIAIFKGCAE
jgi:hypothetical protein